MNSETTTKFKGDIIFNDGEKDILVSDLATVTEVNDALGNYVNVNKIDTYDKMWMNTEPTEPLYLNPEFVYNDDHVMSSKAVHEYVNQSHPPQCIYYDDLIIDDDHKLISPYDEWFLVDDHVNQTRRLRRGDDLHIKGTFKFSSSTTTYSFDVHFKDFTIMYEEGCLTMIYNKDETDTTKQIQIVIDDGDYFWIGIEKPIQNDTAEVTFEFARIEYHDVTSKLKLMENQLKVQRAIIDGGYEFAGICKHATSHHNNDNELYVDFIFDNDEFLGVTDHLQSMFTITDDNGIEHIITCTDKNIGQYMNYRVLYDGQDCGGYIDDPTEMYIIKNNNALKDYANTDTDHYTVKYYRKRATTSST